MSNISSENDRFCELLEQHMESFGDCAKKFNTPHKITRKTAVITMIIWCPCLLLTVMFQIPGVEAPQFIADAKSWYPFTFVVFFSIWCLAYFTNRMRGYTRGWSRNQTMANLLKSMKQEYLEVTKGESEDFIKNEQNQRISNIFALLEKNHLQKHQDIVGDYFASHAEAAKAVQGAKK